MLLLQSAYLPIASPEILTPGCGSFAALIVEIFHQHNLYSCSKLFHDDSTGVGHDVVIVVIGSNTGKLLGRLCIVTFQDGQSWKAETQLRLPP
jgi:hypothetical protein